MSRTPAALLCGAFLSLVPLLGSAPQEGDHEETVLDGHMNRIDEELGKLRRSLRDEAKNAASLASLTVMQRESVAAKELVPELAAGLPAEEAAALTRAYRRMMVDFVAVQLEVEAALLDGEAEAARAAFKRLRSMEDEGHERFTVEEE